MWICKTIYAESGKILRKASLKTPLNGPIRIIVVSESEITKRMVVRFLAAAGSHRVKVIREYGTSSPQDKSFLMLLGVC